MSTNIHTPAGRYREARHKRRRNTDGAEAGQSRCTARCVRRRDGTRRDGEEHTRVRATETQDTNAKVGIEAGREPGHWSMAGTNGRTNEGADVGTKVKQRRMIAPGGADQMRARMGAGARQCRRTRMRGGRRRRDKGETTSDDRARHRSSCGHECAYRREQGGEQECGRKRGAQTKSTDGRNPARR